MGVFRGGWAERAMRSALFHEDCTLPKLCYNGIICFFLYWRNDHAHDYPHSALFRDEG